MGFRIRTRSTRRLRAALPRAGAPFGVYGFREVGGASSPKDLRLLGNAAARWFVRVSPESRRLPRNLSNNGHRQTGATNAQPRAGSCERSLAMLRLLFESDYLRGFAVRLWNGTIEPSIGPARFTIVLAQPWALRNVFTPPFGPNAARTLVEGAIDFDGDAEAAIDAVRSAFSRVGPATLLRLTCRARKLPPVPANLASQRREPRLRGRRHSVARDRAAIAFHYDQPTEFFRTFLDENLVYSCAYWDDGPDAVATLGEAQTAKLDHLLRKLRIRDGQRLVDIGCGYGSLAIRAAERFGAQVVGITLSRTQKEEAVRRIAERGLGDRVRVELRDYRELRGERFDAAVSVGMVEHVGRNRLRDYLGTVYELVRPGGRFLNHGISSQTLEGHASRRESFIERYVFPDGELWPVSVLLGLAEKIGFEIRDVENLREHYVRTLRAWLANLETHRDAAVRSGGPAAFRIWRTYIAGSAAAFSRGDLGLFQVLFAKPHSDGCVELPPTRRDLYR